MAISGGYDRTEALLLMTLSNDAYIDRTQLPGESVAAQQARMRQDIDRALTASAYRDWQVAWGPGLNDDRSNMMYVAGNQAGTQYAVVVRGTDPSFWLDWVQDAGAVLGLVRFPYTTASAQGTIQIAAGTSVGLSQLVSMTGMTSSGAQQDLVTFLQGAGAHADIFVTGHSLGGCLASVVALWLADRLGSPQSLKVYTFAAPSAGNGDFARYYNKLFRDAAGNSTSIRVYNTLDVIPNAWMTLTAIENLYNPSPACTDELKMLIGLAGSIVGTNYTQPGTTKPSIYPLDGTVIPPPAAPFPLDPLTDSQFLFELNQQHATSMYLKLLGAAATGSTVAKLRGMALNRPV
jgi:hypothetical protein